MPTDLFDNAEYLDQLPPADSVYSTPPERSQGGSLSIHGRVTAVDPNKGRCLVENCVEDKAVDYSHCLARSYRSNSNFLDSLEWAWDLPRDTLNIDTRYNILRLTATLHPLFDDNSWFLLPESDIIDQYYDALTMIEDDMYVVRGRFPVIPNVNFKYKFIPVLSKMKRMAIMRQFTAPIPVTSDATITVEPLPVKSDFTVHMFPFNTLPPLVTHLHPRFVICNTAAKMKIVSTRATRRLYHDYPILYKIVAIYEAWTRPIPPHCLTIITFNPPDGPPDNKTDQSGSSERHTINTRSGLKRRRVADQKDRGSPEPRRKGGEGPKGSGQKRAIYPRLSEETLQVHDIILGSELTKSLQATRESVDKWMIDCGKVRNEKGGWKVMRFFGRKECY